MRSLLLSILLLSACMAGAQVQTPQRSAGNHATLDSVTAFYRLSGTAPGKGPLLVKASVAIRLKPAQSPARLFVKLTDPVSQAQLYAVDYAADSAPIAAQGDTLFKVDGRGRLLVSCPGLLPLKRYTWSIYTQNAQGQSSSVFSTKQ